MLKKMNGVPCFLREEHGYTKTNLKNTQPPYREIPKWVCTNWKCPIKGDRGVVEDVYKPMEVSLGKKNGLKGVTWCGGAGLLER